MIAQPKPRQVIQEVCSGYWFNGGNARCNDCRNFQDKKCPDYRGVIIHYTERIEDLKDERDVENG